MKKKVDTKSIFAVVALLCFVALFFSYMFGYKKFEERANSLANENNELNSRLESLQAYFDSEERNKKDIETMTANLDEIYSRYAGDVRQEDGIYQGILMNEASDITYSSIGFGGNVPILTIPVETVQAAGLENYQNEISFNEFDVTYDGIVGYDEFKELVNSLDGSNYDLALGSISFTGTDQGRLQGTTLVSFYSVSGIDAEYNEPPVAPYEVGTGNLFGFNFIEKEEEED